MSLGVDGGDPTRLARGGGDPTVERAAELLRVLEAPPPRLPAAARARIAARLEEAARPAPRGRPRYFWPALAGAALILFAGGAVGAAWGLAPVRSLFARFSTTPAPELAARPAARVTPAPPPAEAPTAIDVAPSVPPPAPRAHVAPKRSPVAPPPAEDPVVAESRLLGAALTSLRQKHDALGALRALDGYEERFPDGALALEASAARVDALLALGRRGKALERLEDMPLERAPRGVELRVLRGELRAGRAECAAAIEDFSSVIGAKDPVPPAVVERALYGRGSCRSRTGDQAGARADLQEVLRRFPTGAFAGPAGRALGE